MGGGKSCMLYPLHKSEDNVQESCQPVIKNYIICLPDQPVLKPQNDYNGSGKCSHLASPVIIALLRWLLPLHLKAVTSSSKGWTSREASAPRRDEAGERRQEIDGNNLEPYQNKQILSLISSIQLALSQWSFPSLEPWLQ